MRSENAGLCVDSTKRCGQSRDRPQIVESAHLRWGHIVRRDDEMLEDDEQIAPETGGGLQRSRLLVQRVLSWAAAHDPSAAFAGPKPEVTGLAITGRLHDSRLPLAVSPECPHP